MSDFSKKNSDLSAGIPAPSSGTSSASIPRRRRMVIGLILFLCFMLGAWLASNWVHWQEPFASAESNQIAIRVLPVNVLTIEHVDSMIQSRTYTGMIRAKNRSDLGFEMTGKIVDVFVEEGDNVSFGAPLAKLDDEILTAQKHAIQASIEQAESRFAELESGPRNETIRAARSARDAARSQFKLAQSSLERRQSLRDQGAISSEEFDAARFGLQTAEANLKSADHQLEELEAGTRSEQLDAQTAALRQLEASLEEIDVALTKSILRAPFPGTITERYLDPGSIAPASASVIRLVAQQDLECWIGLPVEIVAELEVGSEQTVTVGTQDYPAKVIAKIKELDPVTRTQTVILSLDSAASRVVVSGQLCELEISSQIDAQGFWIPNSALSKGVRGLWSVLVVRPDRSAGSFNPNASVEMNRSASVSFRVEKRDIEVLRTESNRVLVRGTLQQGDRIVVDGVHRITGGQVVEPIE